MDKDVLEFIDEIVVYRYHVTIRLKTGLWVLDELDTDFDVKRKEVYEYSGSRTIAV